MNDRASLVSARHVPAVARHASQDMAPEPGPQHIVVLGTSQRRTMASSRFVAIPRMYLLTESGGGVSDAGRHVTGTHRA
jgi:hypothetical protein